jgi:hypothetical protein
MQLGSELQNNEAKTGRTTRWNYQGHSYSSDSNTPLLTVDETLVTSSDGEELEGMCAWINGTVLA